MDRRWFVTWCCLLLVRIGSAPLLACGDKILVPTRGTRFDLTPSARRKAAVLVYMDPTSPMPALFNRLSLAPALQKAGYQPTIVTSDADLDKQLDIQRWDVVLVPLGVSPRLPSAKARGTRAVLAMAVNVTKAQLKQAKGQYFRIVKSPDRSQTVVEAFDDAIAFA